MKGIHGLILAIGLGIAGALFNFAYLAKRSREVDAVGFVGIKKDKVIGRGEPIREDSLERVDIPQRWVGTLNDFAVLWTARQTVTGRSPWRALEGPALLLRSDLRTPPQELTLAPDERAVGVPIDAKKFVPALVQPGDFVSFIVTASRLDYPMLALENPGKTEPAKDAAAGKAEPKDAAGKGGPPVAPRRPQPSDTVDEIGPFKVLSIGNRLGSADVMQAARIPQMQENVMTIRVRIENGKMEPEAARLMRFLEQTNSRPLAYVLHPRTEKQEP